MLCDFHFISVTYTLNSTQYTSLERARSLAFVTCSHCACTYSTDENESYTHVTATSRPRREIHENIGKLNITVRAEAYKFTLVKLRI